MTHSIYHFFADLIVKKVGFTGDVPLEDFPFDDGMLSCRNAGVFPDLAIKLNRDMSVFTGGELVELKSSNNYSIASFNSTIPAGEKNILKITKGANSNVRRQMEAAGDDVDALPVRQVYYLVRGRRKQRGSDAQHVKVCLVHGSFFETIPAAKLISSSFEQAMNERLAQASEEITDELKQKLLLLFSEQETFSRVRRVEKASVRLRFRVMTEVTSKANILNRNEYASIADDTLNFVAPFHTAQDRNAHVEKLKTAFEQTGNHELFSRLMFAEIKHHLNGNFFVAQIGLK
ncbi:MAG: hypothetical protein MSG64_15935 [Pyrinomonadaceae bacterium MAG19_C2-C3]|nr:hypothetical protein [Pyrinomonadaceae bacterium MAG19_C2-C3]